MTLTIEKVKKKKKKCAAGAAVQVQKKNKIIGLIDFHSLNIFPSFCETLNPSSSSFIIHHHRNTCMRTMAS